MFDPRNITLKIEKGGLIIVEDPIEKSYIGGFRINSYMENDKLEGRIDITCRFTLKNEEEEKDLKKFICCVLEALEEEVTVSGEYSMNETVNCVKRKKQP